jgi:TonB-dependent receptor-like protein
VIAAAVLLLAAVQFGQSNTGELRLSVTDSTGLGVQSDVELVSESNQVRQTFETGPEGTLVARRLPLGRYRVSVSRSGFSPFAGLLDIQSALPTEFHVTLSVSPVQAQVTVSADETLLDVRGSSTVNRIGADSLQRRVSALPGRSVPELVNTQPGWLLEANGVLHPRGSEYQVQYVVDGLPITDNRSPSFAPEVSADEVHAMSILTGGYPAEYGRKLGGVIEVMTAGEARRGLHSSIVASAGSFETVSGYGSTQYGWNRGTLGFSANVARTNRYLDPPVEENFTNRGTGSDVAGHLEQGVGNADRFGAIVRHSGADFMVPNELVQQEVGQRQDRGTRETSGQFSYQHLFSSSVLADARALVRDLSADLRSNALATPVAARQDRGLRETYVKGTLTAHSGIHEWKAGFDIDVAAIREAFGYRITDADRFAPTTPATLSFDDRADDREQAVFVQDQIRFGPWTMSAGVRWDHYRLLVDEHAISPRLAAAWSWPRADLVVRASYDRAFQTPATENLLLASTADLDSFGDTVARLPVRPSRGNFVDVGASKRLFGKVRLDVTHFVRHMSEFADDDLLLNTGVSFPIAFDRARIHGTEIKLDVPRWHAMSGSISYANMKGVGYLPITGGLLIGDDGEDLLTSRDRFPISQDQRHTVRGRINVQPHRRGWLSLSGAYGSGLPVELEGDLDEAVAQYGDRIVSRVDLEAGTLRPSFSLDASAGVVIVQRQKPSLRIQADVLNLTNRLNVINFAGLFSGTALAAPRSFALRTQLDF